MPMGAIAGVLDIHITEEAVHAMHNSMERRAKGASAVYHSKGKTVLARSTELSETLCYTIHWAGEQYTICFDGRIYNKHQLRNKLLSLGYPIESETEEETLLFGFICWRERLFELLNGEYAMVILCENADYVFLARDRMGIKPLFYMMQQGGLLFASEIKTVLSFPGVEAKVDQEGIRQIMLIGPGRIPGSGVFKDIYELKPGFYGIYKGGNLELRSYWSLQDRVHEDSFEDTVAKIREMVMNAVSNQIQGSSPMGTMLSGGLDSSVLSAICAREYEARGWMLQTFSIDYEDHEKFFKPGRFQPNSDTEFVRIMQEELDSQHYWTVLTPENLVEGLTEAVIARDLPGMADVDSSLLAFAKGIVSHSNVVLSGECADELFGGYPWYREADMMNSDTFPWSNSVHERAEFLQEWLKTDIAPQDYVRELYRNSIFQANVLPECTPRNRRMKELMHLNIYWFMQTLLERGDRMGSHYGLEIRVPFCDYRIAEYLYSVPWDYMDYKGREKGLLREAMKGILPESVLFRKKSPFPKTHDPRYLKMVSRLAEDLLLEGDAPIFQFVERDTLKKLLFTDFEWPWYGQLMRRPQTIAYMLQVNHWLRHYSVRIV